MSQGDEYDPKLQYFLLTSPLATLFRKMILRLCNLQWWLCSFVHIYSNANNSVVHDDPFYHYRKCSFGNSKMEILRNTSKSWHIQSLWGPTLEQENWLNVERFSTFTNWYNLENEVILTQNSFKDIYIYMQTHIYIHRGLRQKIFLSNSIIAVC